MRGESHNLPYSDIASARRWMARVHCSIPIPSSSARGQNPTTCSAPACLLPPAADIPRGAAGIVLMIRKVLGLHRNAGAHTSEGSGCVWGAADVGGIAPPAGALPREGGLRGACQSDSGALALWRADHEPLGPSSQCPLEATERDLYLVPSGMPICGGVFHQANIEPADQRRSLRFGASHGLRKLVCSRMPLQSR
jgi:hypothetical protein